jgi:phenylacetate-CoA ligase
MAKNIEKQSPADIRLFQEKALNELLDYVSVNSGFYREHFRKHGVNPSEIRSLGDLSNIPPTSKDDLQSGSSDFICVKRNRIIDYLTTSGTSGDPVVFALTENDLKRLAYNEYMGFRCAGCTRNDILQLMTTIDRRFMAGMAYFLGSRRLGSAMIRVGNGIPELQWDTIKRFSPTTLIAVPSFLINIIEYAEKNGIDHRSSGVRRAICIGDSLRNTDFSFNTLGRKIHEKWPELDLYSTYASTEMAASFTECSRGQGGHHHPELLIVEFLDDNGKPVINGEAGELTVTTLGVEGMPLVRFRTGDICHGHYEPCGCGRNTMRVGPVIGRKNQMIKFKGTTLYPPALYDILENIDGVRNYVIELSTNPIGTDEILVRVGSELNSESFEKVIKDHFRAKFRVAPAVSFESPEQIAKVQYPSMSRKPLKLIDKRQQ